MYKISVLTPSFNSGKYIERAILNVIEQKYSNFEQIIIDGGSSDNTIEIQKKVLINCLKYDKFKLV